MADFKLNGVTFASESAGVVSLSNANVFPTGHVLQTVNYTETQSFEQVLDNDFETLTNGVTPFGVNITPKVTGSKTLLMITIGAAHGYTGGGSGYGIGVRVKRDSTNIKITTSQRYPQMTFKMEGYSADYQRSATYTLLDDTPNVKGVQVAYTLAVQRHQNTSTYTMAFNEIHSWTSASNNLEGYRGGVTSHFIAMEIAP